MEETLSPFVMAALAASVVTDCPITRVTSEMSASQNWDIARCLDERGRAWVIEAPRTAAGTIAVESQRHLLASLDDEYRTGHLLAPVPRPIGFPKRVGGARTMVYPAFEGRPLEPDDLTVTFAQGLARTLASLHSLRHSVVTASGLPDYKPADCKKRILSEIDEAALTGAIPSAVYERWEAVLDDVSLWRFAPSVVHGALSGDCVFVADRRVVGISDFSLAHVGDPAEDFAWFVSMGSDEFIDEFAACYARARRMPSADDLLARASFLSEIALVRWLLHGARSGDEEVVEEARDMLRELEATIEASPEQSAIGSGKPEGTDEDTVAIEPPSAWETEALDMDDPARWR